MSLARRAEQQRDHERGQRKREVRHEIELVLRRARRRSARRSRPGSAGGCCASWRGVNVFWSSARSRVWSGGSRNTSHSESTAATARTSGRWLVNSAPHLAETVGGEQVGAVPDLEHVRIARHDPGAEALAPVHGIAIAQPGEGRVGIARDRGRFQVDLGAHGPNVLHCAPCPTPLEGPASTGSRARSTQVARSERKFRAASRRRAKAIR